MTLNFQMSQLPEHIQAVASGAFRGRVGHKAGGFIAKKKFHPSNFDNQEKLWLAKEEKRKEEKLQDEYSRTREEERRLEILRDEIFNTTGVKQPGNLSGNFLSELTPEQKKAAEQTKLRLEAVKRKTGEFGHTEVWGSYFQDGRWGYGCCQCLNRGDPCNKRKRETLNF